MILKGFLINYAIILFVKNIYQEPIHFKLGYFQDSSPIPHQKLNQHWLLPAKILNNRWELFVGRDYKRLFSFDNLHNELKIKYCFIQAWGHQYKKDSNLIGEIELFTKPNSFDEMDIGWRVSDSWFTFIVSEELLLFLRGETFFIKSLTEKFK